MYFVSTGEDMHRLAQKISEMDPGIMTADFGEFSPGIRQSLLAIREGVPLASAKRELDKLYDEWEADGFPVEAHDEDEDWTEGDPDAFPDPEHAP